MCRARRSARRHHPAQLADEVHRLVLDRHRAIAPRSLQAIAHPAIDEQLESIARDRQACVQLHLMVVVAEVTRRTAFCADAHSSQPR